MLLFTIVVPAYNAEATLAETLDSVLVQRFEDWECVVVDDGSIDGTTALARMYAERDSRIRVIRQENRGTGGAYNTGVRAASGAWVTICSADDALLPECLEVMGHAIERHAGCDIYSCNGYFWCPDGSRALVYEGKRGAVLRSWSLEEVFERCFFSVGACYKRGLFDRIGGYDESIFGEDYDFWLRAMSAGATHLYVPEALALHRVSAFQKSADKKRAYESDIRSIQAVLGSGRLSASQARAARSAIRLRRSLIADVERPNSPGRVVARRLRSVLGQVRRG